MSKRRIGSGSGTGGGYAPDNPIEDDSAEDPEDLTPASKEDLKRLVNHHFSTDDMEGGPPPDQKIDRGGRLFDDQRHDVMGRPHGNNRGGNQMRRTRDSHDSDEGTRGQTPRTTSSVAPAPAGGLMPLDIRELKLAREEILSLAGALPTPPGKESAENATYRAALDKLRQAMANLKARSDRAYGSLMGDRAWLVQRYIRDEAPEEEVRTLYGLFTADGQGPIGRRSTMRAVTKVRDVCQTLKALKTERSGAYWAILEALDKETVPVSRKDRDGKTVEQRFTAVRILESKTTDEVVVVTWGYDLDVLPLYTNVLGRYSSRLLSDAEDDVEDEEADALKRHAKMLLDVAEDVQSYVLKTHEGIEARKERRSDQENLRDILARKKAREAEQRKALEAKSEAPPMETPEAPADSVVPDAAPAAAEVVVEPATDAPASSEADPAAV